MKVCICATYHAQYNGYAKVAYELSRRLAVKDDIQLTYYGFQNFHPSGAKHKRDLPESVTIYDAAANENPKKKGFGIDEAQQYFTENEFDVVVIYNDMIIINALLEQIKKISNRKFKIIAYIDQVYLYQKKPFIESINRNCDAAMAFTPAWKDCLVEQGLAVPIIDLRHGIDTSTYFTVPKKLARKYFGLSQDDFIVMNLNRNQPRKRWDVCLKAFAEAVSRVHDKGYKRTLKLLIATSLTGAWNLLEVYERELKKRNLTMEQGQKHLIIIDAPQRLPDCDVNILMNSADVGINTCDGEGFGLCQFEQAAVGVPQIVPNIGGFMDFFNQENAVMCDPILNYYVDSCRDGVGGEAQICDYADFTAGILTLYKNPDMLRSYGQKAKEAITKSDSYNWDCLSDKLYEFIKKVRNTSEHAHSSTETASLQSETPSMALEPILAKDGPVSVCDATSEQKPNPETLDVNLVQLPEKKDDLSEIKKQIEKLQNIVKKLEVAA